MLYPQSRRSVEAAALTPKVFDPDFDIEESRRQARELAAGQPREDVEQVLDVDADGVRCRLYRPRDAREGTLVHLHGGGFVFHDIDVHDATTGVHERQRITPAPGSIGLGEHAHARVEHVEDEPRPWRQVPSHRPEAGHQVLGLVQVQQGVGGDDDEVERSAQVEVAHVALHPFRLHAALAGLASSLGEHGG